MWCSATLEKYSRWQSCAPVHSALLWPLLMQNLPHCKLSLRSILLILQHSDLLNGVIISCNTNSITTCLPKIHGEAYQRYLASLGFTWKMAVTTVCVLYKTSSSSSLVFSSRARMSLIVRPCHRSVQQNTWRWKFVKILRSACDHKPAVNTDQHTKLTQLANRQC